VSLALVSLGFDDSVPTDPKALLHLAESHYAEGAWSEAEELFTRILAALERPAGAPPVPQQTAVEAARMRRRCLFLLADVYRHLRRREEALQTALQHRREVEALAGVDVRTLLRDNALVVAEDQIALERLDEARALLHALLRGKYGPLPQIPKLETLVKLATVDDLAGKKADALKHWAQAHAIAVELLSKYKKDLAVSDQVRCSRYLILCNEALGDVELATKELESLEKLHAQQRDNGFQKRQTQLQLAAQCLLRKDYARAELYLRRALNDPQAADDALARAHLYSLLANLFQEQEKAAEAQENWKQSAALYETLLAGAGPLDLPLRAGTLRQLRTIYQEMNRPQDARRAAEQLYTLRKQEFGEQHPLTLEAKTVLEKLEETAAR
jgi:hypothetical protein